MGVEAAVKGPELVDGSGWISDESEFYGDEVTQRKYEEQAKSFVPALYYSMKLDSTKDRAVQLTVPPKSIHSSNGTVSGLAMRTNSNQVTAPQTNPRLYNPYEGDPNALQIGESVEDFLHHLPPSTTYAANLGPWLWAANFFSASRPLDTNPIPYIRIGNDLLTAHSTALKMQELEMPHHTKAAIANVAKQLKADTTKYLLQAARNCGVLVGKWMLFPYASEVDQVWEKVVRATVDGRLGISCKVATRESDDSGDVAFAARTRLVCVYTRDFGDEDDVKRVLNGLVEMGLVPERGGIWYKCDAFTHLEINSGNEWGLRASMYGSKEMLARKGDGSQQTLQWGNRQ